MPADKKVIERFRLLLGVNIFWLALSFLFDGINTLVLPLQIRQVAGSEGQATLLGLLTLTGLLLGALVQPAAGALSDRWKPVLGRKGIIGVGLVLCIMSLFLFARSRYLTGLVVGYILIQVSASLAQAGQQGLIPDLVDENRRGLASGLKGFMDLTGAMLGFVLLGQFLGSGRTQLALAVLAGVLILAYLLAILLTPEDRPGGIGKMPPKSISLSGLFRLDLTEHRTFKHVLIARFLFLFGVYAIGRFLLFFVAQRLGLSPNQAAEQAGTLLAGLALVTLLASPVTGWLADRTGRIPVMIAGAVLGAAGAFLLIWADSAIRIFLFGSLMSLGSAAFASGSWALLADIVPRGEPARFFGLANFSTAGPAAAVGLLGPLIDGFELASPGSGYSLLFIISSAAFVGSVLPILNESRRTGEQNGNERKDRAHASGLAVVSLPADPADLEEDQDPPRGTPEV
ncbi:MAG TPA: MFS transporter [Anaerolineales bacterium]|nr:MFS transporter [Anaerolineales bacterium]